MVSQTMMSCTVDDEDQPSDLINDKKKAIAIVYIVSSFLSCIGAASVIIFAAIKKTTQTAEVRPLIPLAVADFFLSFWWMLGAAVWMIQESDPSNASIGIKCFYIDLFAELFHLASFFLTVNYGVNVYKRLRDRANTINNFWISVNNTHLRTSFPRWISVACISWLLPVILMTPLLVHFHGEVKVADNPLCSKCLLLFDRPKPLKHMDVGEEFWYLYGSIVLVASIGISIMTLLVIYFMVHRIYQRSIIRSGFLTDTQRLSIDVLRNRIFLYIVVFLYCWVPALVVASVDLYPGDKPLGISKWYPLFIIQGLSAPMQGFLNSLVYGWTRTTFRNAQSRRPLLEASQQSTLELSYGSTTVS